jgi:type IX secretion system PorP/SprF family membrane protein
MKLQYISRTIMATLLLSAIALSSKAQLNPFQAIYYQNPYLYNPAMAGMEKVLNINTGYRQQWSSFAGTPKTTAFTADFQPVDRVGVGININDDQAGLIRQTRIMGTYAYHLPLGDREQQLHFGLSLGLDDSRVDYASIKGDVSDTEVAQYNQLKAYVDGDFGIGYTDQNLNIGAAVPNLKSAFFKSSDSRFDADRLLFITVVSYKLPLTSGTRSFLLQPLLGYRIVKGYDNIIDGGFNLAMNNYGIYLQAIYHSSESLGLGFGVDQNTYALNFAYNLETGQLRNYTLGGFEVGIKLRLFEK